VWPEAKQAADQVREWGIKVRGNYIQIQIEQTTDITAAIADDLAASERQGERCAFMGG
jgi:hypothetical protein